MRKALIILLLCVLPYAGSAKDLRFLSDRLHQLALIEGTAVPDYRGRPMETCSFRHEGKSYPVVVEYTPEGVIHIGMDIFGPEIKKENPTVYRFVERYMLELHALYSPSEVKRVMNADGVYVTGNIDHVIGMACEGLQVAYKTTDGALGEVFISRIDGSSLFGINFPLSFSLLSGMDKAELDAFFITGLRMAEPAVNRAVPSNLSRIEKELYVSENGYYETPSVQNCSFFQKRQNNYYPVCESCLPKESVMTLLTGYLGTKLYTAHLKQFAYNYSTVEVDIPLAQLLNYCMDSGCTPFVGIETCNSKGIRASLFMVNEALGYCHTFKVDLRSSLLDQEKGTMDISVYSYTPVHNLHK